MQSVRHVPNIIRYKYVKPSFLVSKLPAQKVTRLISGVFDYDLVVIGGDPGGLAAAKEACSLGAKVAVADNVTPTTSGTPRNLEETLLNADCISMKLLHQAALLGDALQDSKSFGWRLNSKIGHNWQSLTDALQAQIKSVNSITTEELKDKGIRYINGLASFENPHLLHIATKQAEYKLSSKYFLIAVGGRPRYPDIPGALAHGITSKEIFTLNHPPGKSLIIGAGCVGLECAGALNVLGFDTSVMIRSIPLRGCDQQMASIVKAEMQSRGVNFLSECSPKSITKMRSGKLKIQYYKSKIVQPFSEEYDTILFAIGRRALTKELQLQRAGVQMDSAGDKIIALNEQTNVPHVYAVGEVLYGRPNVPPIAVQAGRLLSRRLFGGSKETMDYQNTPTTILAPLEYGFVGLSEETAIHQYGEDAIEVYHNFYKPAEFGVTKKDTSSCYLKVIALRQGEQTVLGMHIIGPQAGEIIQGFSAAMRCNLTVDSLVNTVGIHPTLAEEFTRINITKRSGRDPSPASCCS